MADCPLYQAPCKEHGCKWYIQILGKHPQTEEHLSKWDCAIAWLPILQIETSQQSRQTGAAVESFRNEMVKQNKEAITMTKLMEIAHATT